MGEGGTRRGRAVQDGGGRCKTGKAGARRGMAVQDGGGRCKTREGGARHVRTVQDGGGRYKTGRAVQDGGGRCKTGKAGARRGMAVQDGGGRCKTGEDDARLRRGGAVEKSLVPAAPKQTFYDLLVSISKCFRTTLCTCVLWIHFRTRLSVTSNLLGG